MHMGIPLTSAVRAATENPARAIGIEDRCGRIEVGRTADCVILDADLNVRDVIVRGTLLANSFR
jgi:N-acetylglucosamine-6-phosphate deacetylase